MYNGENGALHFDIFEVPYFKIVTTYGNVSLIKDLIQIFHPFIKYLCFVTYGFHGFPFEFIANIHK